MPAPWRVHLRARGGDPRRDGDASRAGPSPRTRRRRRGDVGVTMSPGPSPRTRRRRRRYRPRAAPRAGPSPRTRRRLARATRRARPSRVHLRARGGDAQRRHADSADRAGPSPRTRRRPRTRWRHSGTRAARRRARTGPSPRTRRRPRTASARDAPCRGVHLRARGGDIRDDRARRPRRRVHLRARGGDPSRTRIDPRRTGSISAHAEETATASARPRTRASPARGGCRGSISAHAEETRHDQHAATRATRRVHLRARGGDPSPEHNV